MNDTELTEPIETIAIVGMSGRFPGAVNIDEFWENIKSGTESVSFFTDEELIEEGVEAKQLSNPDYVKAKAYVDDIDKFDAGFFGYSPREAALMDPQHRFFLECTWEALEDSGYNPENYNGVIGLYGGVSLNSYLILNLLSDANRLSDDGILQTSIPNRTDHLTTRVAYKLNLKGPAITVQTACSTSLVAVHLACQSLLTYQTDIALAGGVTLGVPNKSGYVYQEAGVLSPDGHCRAFDAEANGTTVGNGVGVVVLKRLSEALEDGDNIYAVIKGSAINNDGSNKVGFTAPGVDGQIEVISTALQFAGIEPESIDYIETHGTGTSLGDPIEIQALSSVFRNTQKKSCGIGSVKTNIGHLDVAAGVTGLIKTALALKHRQIPPSLNFSKPNPHIDFENSSFYVNTELKEWKKNGTPRRAGVSSFGIGGTNAHVVLEEFASARQSASEKPYNLILLSADTKDSLERATSNISDFLIKSENINMEDVAYTLQTGRKHFKYRRSFACSDRDDALLLLGKMDPQKVFTGLQEPKQRPIAFMFTGQGAQYSKMGDELYQFENVFRETVDECAVYLKAKLGLDIRDLLFARNDSIENCDKKLGQTYLTQPALFVIEYALAKLWESWNVKPNAMIGHSIGEYVAACLAGVFSLEDCLDIVTLRGRLMQDAETGSMLSISLSEEETLPYITENLSLSAVNSPSLCVIGGSDSDIKILQSKMAEDGVDCRLLETSHAFHSKMMEPILNQFKEEIAGIKMNKPTIPFISNTTGQWISDDEAVSPDYWTKHLRNTVRFGDGITNLFENPETILLEIGPGRTLMTIARWHPKKGIGQNVLTSLPHPNDRGQDLEFLLGTVGRLWLLGIDIDWNAFHPEVDRKKISLPTYSFEKQSYWINPEKSGRHSHSNEELLKKKADPADWLYVPSWQRSVALRKLANPELQGQTILCFISYAKINKQIIEQIENSGADVIKIYAADSYSEKSSGTYEINPESNEDFSKLLDSLIKKQVDISKILYCWGLYEAEDRSRLNTTTNFYAPLYLIQKLGEKNQNQKLEIIFITNETFAVTGNENINPAKSLLLGFGKVAPMEYPNLKIRNIDFDFEDISDGLSSKETDNLIGEIFGLDKTPIIAYRNGHRWLQSFESQHLPVATPDQSRLKQKGVYLITGGLGGVGMTLAKYLSENVSASLVLTGRTALPKRENWQDILKSNGNDPANNKIKKQIADVLELEKSGSEVLTFSADITDFEAMKRVLLEVDNKFGKIDGVIHSAGVPAGGMIQLKEKSVADAVLQPKVQGTLVLEKLFKDTDLDFMAICSSRNAILGGFGQIDYCSANNFCDAFAHYYSKRYDTFAVSINWDAWQEVGMLVDTAHSYGADKSKLNGDNSSKKTNIAEQEIVHPLLGSVLEKDENSTTFISEHNINRQWVLEEHRIGANPVIPGVTYLEMARAAMEYKEGDIPMEISEVYFITPMSLKDDETRFIKFVIERKKDHYTFTAKSTKDDYADDDAEWRDHVFGKLTALTESPTPKHDIEDIIKQCNIKELSADEHELDPDLGPRWQNIKKAYVGKDQYLVNFEINSEFKNDLEVYKLHPSLLDRAAGSGMLYIDDLDAVYLPFSYKSLLYRRPLTRNIYAHIIQTESYRKGMETVTFDVIITDEIGNELVKIDEFSEKRINNLSEKIKTIAIEGSTIAQKPKSVKSKTNFYEESLQEGILPLEGADIFGRILTHSILPQIVVSTKDLNTSIEKAKNFTQESVAQEIDKIKTPAFIQERPDISTEFIAPRNELETKLAKIMAELLGIEKIGIEDNFFELGGDSILSIQIISKAKKEDLEITPQQVFQHQTVASLATVVSGTANDTEPEEVVDEFAMVDFDENQLDAIASMIGESD